MRVQAVAVSAPTTPPPATPPPAPAATDRSTPPTPEAEAYDQLVRVAGVDWRNEEFLTAGNNFADTVLTDALLVAEGILEPAVAACWESRRWSTTSLVRSQATSASTWPC